MKLLRDLAVNLAANGLWAWGGSAAGSGVVTLLALVAGVSIQYALLLFVIFGGLLLMGIAEVRRARMKPPRETTPLPSRFERTVERTNSTESKPRPLPLRARCEKFAQEIEDYIGRMDSMPVARGAGMGFVWLLTPAWALRNELELAGYKVAALDRLLYDAEGIGRREAEAMIAGLRAIDWKQG